MHLICSTPSSTAMAITVIHRFNHILVPILGLLSFLSIHLSSHCCHCQAFSMSTPSTPSTTTQSLSSTDNDDSMRFGKFLIDSTSIFYKSSLSAAFVNLRPIVPGHVLVMPHRVVATMEELTQDEYTDLWISARKVQSVLKHQYQASAFNVAVQDGRAAGQSVPHVHVHILPRQAGDFERNDDVYDALERWAPREELKQAPSNLEVPDDADRKDRTQQMMAAEAAMYRRLFEQQQEEEHE
uniref:HIT domain-containing protein n=1 Tax=Craspedostauros australis TaxID=1486917 RepID=A0A7R9WYV3_9STRA